MYMGSYFTSDENTTKMPDWTRVDAAIGYKDTKWGATVAVNNLTDKEYWRLSSMPGTPNVKETLIMRVRVPIMSLAVIIPLM